MCKSALYVFVQKNYNNRWRMWLAVILYSGFLVARFLSIWEGFFVRGRFVCPEVVMLLWTFVNVHENTVDDTSPVVKRSADRSTVYVMKRCCKADPMCPHQTKQKQGSFVKLVHWWEDKDRCWHPILTPGWKLKCVFTACWNLHAVKVLYKCASLPRLMSSVQFCNRAVIVPVDW